MAINVPVEIFVIKRLSVLNLVVISSRNADKGHNEIAFVQSEKTATLLLQELAQSSPSQARSRLPLAASLNRARPLERSREELSIELRRRIQPTPRT
jgi:hypothetical protein